MNDLTVGILMNNRLQITKKYLPSVVKKIGDYPVFLLDNGSTDGTTDWLKKFNSDNKKLKKIFNKTNLQVGAHNQILKLSNTKYYMKLDDDLIIPKDTCEVMLDVFLKLEKKHNIGLLGLDMKWGNSTYVKSIKKAKFNKIKINKHNIWLVDNTIRKLLINGACLLTKKSIIEEIGGFPWQYPSDKKISNLVIKANYNTGWVMGINGSIVQHFGPTRKQASKKFDDSYKPILKKFL